MNRGNFVTNAFQDVSKSNQIVEHENHDYHQTALENAKCFIENVENPTASNFNRGSNETYEKNLHILKRIIRAVLLCAEQGLALRGRYDHYQPDDEPCERSWNRGNFIAILYAFADMDPILKEHLDHGARNAKMISWKIQNEIIASTA